MFKELCRLCGFKNDKTLDIFSEHGHNQKLELKIKQIVRLNVSTRYFHNKLISIIQIYSLAGKYTAHAKILFCIFFIQILEEDPLPKIICVSCNKYLKNVSYFIDRCHQTQIYLDQLYRDSIPPVSILIVRIIFITKHLITTFRFFTF